MRLNPNKSPRLDRFFRKVRRLLATARAVAPDPKRMPAPMRHEQLELDFGRDSKRPD